MDSDIVQSDVLWRTWAWLEKNKKQAALATVAALVIGFIIYFITWQRAEKEAEASRALSAAFAEQSANIQGSENPNAYLDVAKQFPDSDAAGMALLMAATTLFEQGKYEQAHAEFQRFSRENAGSPFLSQALFGVASCLEAQGKADQASETYNSVIERYPNSPVLPQAKFSLARLLEAKGNLERALMLYEDVGRDRFSSLGSQAGLRAEELKQQHPELAAKVTPPVPALSPATNAAPATGTKK